MSYNKDYVHIKACVDWFVHNGVPAERIRVEITPRDVVVLAGSESITKKPLVQVIHRTRRTSADSTEYGRRTDARGGRAIDAANRYRKVLADVIKIDAAVKQLERP